MFLLILICFGAVRLAKYYLINVLITFTNKYSKEHIATYIHTLLRISKLARQNNLQPVISAQEAWAAIGHASATHAFAIRGARYTTHNGVECTCSI